MVTKKKTVKKPIVKKLPVKNSSELKSFKRQKETAPFMSFKITKQTVYWSVLVVYIMILMLWISHIQLETMQILNNIKVS